MEVKALNSPQRTVWGTLDLSGAEATGDTAPLMTTCPCSVVGHTRGVGLGGLMRLVGVGLS